MGGVNFGCHGKRERCSFAIRRESTQKGRMVEKGPLWPLLAEKLSFSESAMEEEREAISHLMVTVERWKSKRGTL